MGSVFDGQSICAYDTDNGFLLITCDDYEYLATPYVQELCRKFYEKYLVLCWVAKHQAIFPLDRITD